LGKLNVDKTRHNTFDGYEIFDDDFLSNAYDGDGLITKIVNVIPDDMTRAGWRITNDDDNLIWNEMIKMGAAKAINKALKYARLYRGSIIVMVTDRGRLEEPIPKGAKLQQLRVYSASRIEISAINIIKDPNSIYFDDFDSFYIRTLSGDPFQVHRSRCLVFKGELTSDSGNLDLQYRYWGFSTIQKIWERVSNLASTEQSVANLMMELVIGKYSLSNLAAILAQSTQEALTQLYTRIEIINASKSIINAVLLDKDEDYTRDSANVSGMSDIIDRIMMFVSTVSEIPVTRLFGRSPAGLNATGESDERNYYDKVSSMQETILDAELKKLIGVIKGYISPNTLEESDIIYNSLWEPTQKEKAEIDYIKAQTDALYITNGVILPDEIMKQRFPDLDVLGD